MFVQITSVTITLLSSPQSGQQDGNDDNQYKHHEAGDGTDDHVQWQMNGFRHAGTLLRVGSRPNSHCNCTRTEYNIYYINGRVEFGVTDWILSLNYATILTGYSLLNKPILVYLITSQLIISTNTKATVVGTNMYFFFVKIFNLLRKKNQLLNQLTR